MIGQDEYAGRRRELTELVESCNAILITSAPNVRYLSGFTGSNGVLVLTRGSATLLTDPRYTVQAEEETSCKVAVVKGSLIGQAAATVKRKRWKRVAFERERISFASYSALEAAVGSRVELVGLAEVVENSRTVKSPAEVELIRASVELNAKAFARTLKRIKPESTETDVAAEIDYQMRKLGAEASAFESIVASGPRSALPHARPRAQRLGTGRLLLMDTGAVRSGYCSDMTRVVHIGAPGKKARQLYRAVLEAQLAAVDAVRPGVKAGAVDAAARRVLRAHGLERAFVHSTGHGLGLEIHEPPRIGKRGETRLAPGMTITIEPGAYLEGFGGVRIEDTVVVTAGGCEVLTPVSKEFVAI